MWYICTSNDDEAELSSSNTGKKESNRLPFFLSIFLSCPVRTGRPLRRRVWSTRKRMGLQSSSRLVHAVKRETAVCARGVIVVHAPYDITP